MTASPEVVLSLDALSPNDLVCFRYHRYEMTKQCVPVPTLCVSRALLLQPADFAIVETRIMSDLLSIQQTTKMPESAWRPCLMYGKRCSALCLRTTAISHPLHMFVLRQFFLEVSQKIAKLDWLGAAAASAEQFRAFSVRSTVNAIIIRQAYRRQYPKSVTFRNSCFSDCS
jgi:hypothetical protein